MSREIPPESKHLIIEGLLKKESGEPLTPEEQATIRRYAPSGTLPLEEVATAPTCSREGLLVIALREWDHAETIEDLEGLLRDGYPNAPPEMVREVLEEVREKKRLDISVLVSTSTEPGGVEVSRYYKTSPQQGILAITKKVRQGEPPREGVEFILTYGIWEAKKHINPLDSSEVKYTLILKNNNTSETIRYEELPLADITHDLANNQPGMLDSRRRVHAAISALLDAMEKENLLRKQIAIPATGYFEDKDGALYHNETRDLPVRRPDYNKVQVRKALKALEEVLRFYAVRGDLEVEGGLDHALTVLYYIVGAPLSAIRKHHGREIKLLLMHGTPHTGKTLLEKLNSRIWGLPESKTVIGAGKLTPPQLAEHLSKTTYAVSFDEVRNALSVPGIADLLKSSTTNLLIKERIRPKEGFRKQSFYAYAPVIMSTNFLPDLYTGLHERIIPVEFTVRHKRTEDEAKAFDRLFNEHREDLAYIGSALDRLFTRRWSRIKDLILQPDQIKAGYEILTLLYLEEGLPSPVWLREVTVRSELEEPDPVRILCDFLREDLMRILRQNLRPENIPLDWDQRLDTLKERNLLPPYLLNVSSKRLTLSSGILREVAKRGHEIPGGLTGVQDMINALPEQTRKGKVTPYKGQKALSMDREVFYAYSAPIEYQEELKGT